MANRPRGVLPIPERRHVGVTTYDAKDPDTSFPPIMPLRPPPGAPNVLIILLDDVGFGASSAFGGPSSNPVAERLPAKRRTSSSREPCGCEGGAGTGSTPRGDFPGLVSTLPRPALFKAPTARPTTKSYERRHVRQTATGTGTVGKESAQAPSVGARPGHTVLVVAVDIARMQLLEAAVRGEIEHDGDPLDKSVRTVGCAPVPKSPTGFACKNWGRLMHALILPVRVGR